jgi:hypothetical protein
MSDRIEGADWSHWQGRVNCPVARAAGIRFVGIKVGQGINYKDDMAEVNNDAARAAGILTFPYFFVTTDAPTAQYDWLIKCIGDMSFDLAPALDYEYYNQMTGEPYKAMNEGDYEFPCVSMPGSFEMWEAEWKAYGIVIPAASTLYTIATKLKGWHGCPVPAIYTNVSTANAKLINTTIYKWDQFLPWLAQWNVTAPTIPTAWKGKPLYLWQDRVIKGAQDWGVQGDMDHDFWMDALPFPGDVPAEKTYQYSGYDVKRKTYLIGTLKERC